MSGERSLPEIPGGRRRRKHHRWAVVYRSRYRAEGVVSYHYTRFGAVGVVRRLNGDPRLSGRAAVRAVAEETT